MMSNKERMMKAIHGEYADQIPWVPRFDLWYNAHRYRKTLPDEFKDLTPGQIAQKVGVGEHKITPDFMDYRDLSDIVDRPLGIYNFPVYPYRTELKKVKREVKVEGDCTRVTYHTSKGSVSARVRYDEGMRRAGVSHPWIEEPVIKGPEDCPIVGYIFENLELTPDYEGYKDHEASLGDNGLSIGLAHLSAGPYQVIMAELMTIKDFYMQLFYLNPKKVRQLAESMTPYFNRILEITSECPAFVVRFGGNYDEVITFPPLFKEYLMPWIQKFADRLHENRKFLLSHCDGENGKLLDLIQNAGIDIVEGLAPAPMTRLTIHDYYQKWGKGDRLTIFGGVPSILLMETVSEEEFELFMKRLFREIAPGRRFILGMGDTAPPDSNFQRILKIAEMCRKWGSLPLNGM